MLATPAFIAAMGETQDPLIFLQAAWHLAGRPAHCLRMLVPAPG
jgi:hypothetical protein